MCLNPINIRRLVIIYFCFEFLMRKSTGMFILQCLEKGMKRLDKFDYRGIISLDLIYEYEKVRGVSYCKHHDIDL